MIATTVITEARKLDLDKILIKVRTRAPGFFVLASLVDTVFSSSVPTACTNGKHIWFGNEFWGKLSQKERAFILLHEVLHIALCHHLRRGDRDPNLFNQAADYVINRKLVELVNKNADWLSFPTGENAGLLDTKYDGLNEYDIYRLLAESTQPKQDSSDPASDQADGSDQGKLIDQATNGGKTWGGVIDAEDTSTPEVVETQIKEVEDAVQRAAVVEQMAAGTGSSGVLGSIAGERAKAPKSLQSFLAKFFSDNGSASWSRPNRRLLSQGVVYPGPIKNSVSDIVLAIDTSGSMDYETLRRFLGVIQDLFARSSFTKLHYLLFNDGVYSTKVLKRNEPITLDGVESGGTDVKPVFEYAQKVGAKGLIVFTDGCFNVPQQPKFKVLWALNQPANNISYGTKVVM